MKCSHGLLPWAIVERARRREASPSFTRTPETRRQRAGEAAAMSDHPVTMLRHLDRRSREARRPLRLALRGTLRAMDAPIHVRVPSALQKPAMIAFGVVALGGFWFGVSSFGDGDSMRGATGLAVGFAMIGLNYVIRFRFGTVVEITAEAIVEHAPGGDVRIAWKEPHELEGFDSRQVAIGGSARGAVTQNMVRGAQIRSAAVRTPDGRSIRIDIVLGIDAHAIDAVTRYSRAARAG
jgi:hypothetical protein